MFDIKPSKSFRTAAAPTGKLKLGLRLDIPARLPFSPPAGGRRRLAARHCIPFHGRALPDAAAARFSAADAAGMQARYERVEREREREKDERARASERERERMPPGCRPGPLRENEREGQGQGGREGGRVSE